MRSWKKRWKQELNTAAPKLDDKVKNAAIPVSSAAVQSDGSAAVNLRRNKTAVLIAAALILILAIGGIFLFLPNNGVSESFFTLEINPAVTFCADKDGTVTGVISSNADADVVLANVDISKNIKGKTVKEAVTFFTDAAARLGYINFDGENSAVRISTTGNSGELLTDVKNGLTEYFLGKGVFAAVTAENVDENEFRIRSGLPSELSLKNAKLYIEEQTTLFSLREAEGKSGDELKRIYTENVAKNNFYDFFRINLSEHIELIENNLADISELVSLNSEIYFHPDNPMSVLKDYWNVVKYGGGNYVGEFGELMSRMETELAAYKEKYGKEITGIIELKNLADEYAETSLEVLYDLIENFTKEKFGKYFDVLGRLLQSVGILSDDVSNVLRAPENFGEFSVSAEKAFKLTFESRTEKYAESYSKIREPKSLSDYQNYLSEIEKQYGSLSDYFNAVKNK